jgi:hypothetical protein
MAQDDPIPGFVWGITKVNLDPEGTGRIKVHIPGLVSPYTHYWVMPFGWPSGPNQQPRAPAIDEKVAVMFLHGNWSHPEAKAIYLRGYAGLASDNVSAGPTVNTTANDPRDVNCLYEDDKFSIYIKREGTDESDSNYERRLVLQTSRGTKFEIDASAGAGKKSEVALIEAATAISLYTAGQVDIRGNVVTINGRQVADSGGEI